MRAALFCSPPLHLDVFREDDGALVWHGTYKGTTIKLAVPADDDCVILLDPDASDEPIFRNLLRIGRDGEARWIATLPGTPDAFVDLRRDGDYLVARTWSGFSLRIDPVSGRPVMQEFVK